MANSNNNRNKDPEVNFNTITGTLKNTFAKRPERVNLKDWILWTLVGGAGGAATNYVYSKAKGKDNSYTLPSAFLGSTVGALGYLVKQNIMDQMDAHSSAESNADRSSKITTDPTAPPRTYIFYIKGAGGRFGEYTEPELEKIYGAKNVINYKWGEVDDVIHDINLTRPQDRVILMGHSAGGGAAVKVAENVDRHIDKLITLDPVQLYAKDRIRAGLGLVKKPDNVDIWENHIPENYDKKTWGNVLARLPFTLPQDLKGQRNIKYKDEDHSLWSTALRPDEYKDQKDTFDFKRIAKRVRKEIDTYTKDNKNRYTEIVPLT